MHFILYWKAFCSWCVKAGLPLVAVYHLLCSNVFLNYAAQDAQSLERLGNYALAPFQYLFAGSVAIPYSGIDGQEPYGYATKLRFDYATHCFSRTAASLAALPLSLAIGSLLKGVAYLSPEVRDRHERLIASIATPIVRPNHEYYRAVGIPIGSWEEGEVLQAPVYARRPGDEEVLRVEKQALLEIVRLLTAHKIPFWVDCGTCLGVWRHRGVIPWDNDIDLSVLEPDFDNVRRVLSTLDKGKYAVQDWSGRGKPGTYLKVYVKESRSLIDIYHFAIDPQSRTLTYILSNEESPFLPLAWKNRERQFVIATPFEEIFPLKRSTFDGIEVPVPNQTRMYLEKRYGDISPAKAFDERTGRYEKVSTHPYWHGALAQ